MKLALIMGFSLLMGGCRPAGPDPRQAQVQVHSDIAQTLPVVQEAIDFWSQTTNGDVNMQIVDACDTGDLVCCITISTTRYDELSKQGVWGFETHRINDLDGMLEGPVTIKLDPHGLALAPVDIVAHELGHALLLKHVESARQESNEPLNGTYDFEVMRPVSTSQIGCMGAATALEYKQQWGVEPTIGRCIGIDPPYQWYSQDPAHNPPLTIQLD